MIPLCTTAISPRDTIGWAFSVAGAPCVAQRVWAIPVSPVVFWLLAARSSTRDTVRIRSRLPAFTRASPHESYPRYSRRRSPSISTGTMSRRATAPTIPHMGSGLFPARLPGRNGNLPCARHGKLVCGRVLVDGRAGADVGAARDAHRRDQRGVRADEAVVLDHRAMLGRTVVVTGDRPGADVHARPDLAVAQIREVIRL